MRCFSTHLHVFKRHFERLWCKSQSFLATAFRCRSMFKDQGVKPQTFQQQMQNSQVGVLLRHGFENRKLRSFPRGCENIRASMRGSDGVLQPKCKIFHAFSFSLIAFFILVPSILLMFFFLLLSLSCIDQFFLPFYRFKFVKLTARSFNSKLLDILKYL